MSITIGRRSRLAALGAGLMTAAAAAIASSVPAFANTADTGGSGTLSVPVAVVAGLAKADIAVLPGTPATSSFDPVAGTDSFTLPVTGGDGEVSNFFGTVNYGGSLVFINGANGKSVTVTSVELNFFTGALTGLFPGGTKQTALAYISGDMSSSTSAGPPATETFTTDQLNLSGKAATALNTGLATKAFIKGTDVGGFTTTYDVTIS